MLLSPTLHTQKNNSCTPCVPMFWTAAGNRVHLVLSDIFKGSNKARTTPRLVSFPGLIQIFQQASLTFSYGSPTPGQTHEFIIYAIRQRARADNLTICYRKTQIDFGLSCVCTVIDNEFPHNIVKVVYGSTRLLPSGSTATLTMLWVLWRNS